MALKLTREASLPAVIKRRPIANPELFEIIQEFDESDMDIASIDMDDVEQRKKIEDQTRRYCSMYFDGRIKLAVRKGKIYLMKI